MFFEVLHTIYPGGGWPISTYKPLSSIKQRAGVTTTTVIPPIFACCWV